MPELIIEPVRRLCRDRESDHVAHDWTAAWTDRGGSLWGPGPYLKLPFKWPDDQDGAERIHCPYGYPEDDPAVKSVRLEHVGDLWVWIVEKE